MKYSKIKEEVLKSKVGRDWFDDFEAIELEGNIDFVVFPKQGSIFGRMPLLWAEAKVGVYDISSMFAQLIITIGKARTFDKIPPPSFLGAFDYEKFVFLPYVTVQDIFYMNDFNWNVTPSNHDTEEFKYVKKRIEGILKKEIYNFNFIKDEKELRRFIKNNIAKGSTSKIKINKNNFIPIYLRWLEVIKPIIDVDWEQLKKSNILDSDFFLADIFVDDKNTADISDDKTIQENLFVIFENLGYKIAKENIKQMFDATISLKNLDVYQQFWKSYKRPPIEEFRDYIIKRRDLLVPQDIRERKGAFFTPRIWVELSQKYLSDVLGENWQDEYYIWDCAAGTGNLLAGLTNKYNVWASTLDQADVNVMHERIDRGANLLKSHVFQFDFLNDDFSTLPEGLQEIINDPEKRKKLVIYINPPYAEATTTKTITGTGENKSGVTTQFKIKEILQPQIGNATNEMFILFMGILVERIPNSILGMFSKIKFINGSNFRKFKEYFRAEYKGGFIVPADTFDNVKGKFPIGFTIWDINQKGKIESVSTDIYDKTGDYVGVKNIYGDLPKSINRWVKLFIDKFDNNIVGYLPSPAPDFQNQNFLFITRNIGTRHVYYLPITKSNLIMTSIYFSVRHSIAATWLNDRDQFLYPNDKWENDKEFHNDCLTFTLFHTQNRVTASEGVNYWIPFTEQEVDAKDKFDSNFMTDFINGKLKNENKSSEKIFEEKNVVYDNEPREFSVEAKEVFDAGSALWKYYHEQEGVEVNSSFYDIRDHFQGRSASGRMKSRSDDKHYTALLTDLRFALDTLADKIKPKVYEYGFLKE